MRFNNTTTAQDDIIRAAKDDNPINQLITIIASLDSQISALNSQLLAWKQASGVDSPEELERKLT